MASNLKCFHNIEYQVLNDMKKNISVKKESLINEDAPLK